MQLDGVLKCESIVAAFMGKEQVCERIYNEFGQIKHIHHILKPFYQATVVLQRTDFTMSDFYSTWLQLQNMLRKFLKKYKDDKLVTSPFQCMEKRTQQLIQTPTMMCALALDPRFCGDLDGEHRRLARFIVESMAKNSNNCRA